MAELWDWAYKLGFKADGDARKAAGIRAIKQELVHNGYSAGIVVDMPVFGSGAAAQAKKFQADHGLFADGIVGPKTALVLFRKRADEAATKFGVPDHLNSRQKTLESSNDPVAEGVVDPNDEGICQIHLPFHPDVSIEEAWDPAFALPWGAEYLKGLYSATGSSDWDVALAAYNVGVVAAKKWRNDGKPAGTTESEYVRLVRAASY